jgi:hypothetical protein
MNLKILNMTNFGIFRDRTMEFGPGLNLVFGPNESGKTTVVDAIVLALLSRTDKKGAKLKDYPRALKPVKDRYGSEISLHLVAGHDDQELTFPAPETFQDRWDVGWDELRAIFIAREGDLELVKGEPREFRQWWDALKGKLLGFEEEPGQVLKKIGAEAGLTPNLGLTRAQQDRMREVKEKLDWYRENEERIGSLRGLENAHRDLLQQEDRLTKEVDLAKRGLRKAKLLRAKEIYQQMKADQGELLEKHGRYAEEDLHEWKRLQSELQKEQALLEQLGVQKGKEELEHQRAEAEATRLIKRVGTLGAKLRGADNKGAQLDEAVRMQERKRGQGLPGWAPWASWGFAILALILGLYSTDLLFIVCALLAGLALYLTYRLRKTTRMDIQFLRERDKLLGWGRELGLAATSLRDLQRKIEYLRQEKATLTGQQAQLEGHLKKTTDDLKSLTEKEKAKADEMEKIRANIQALREKTGLGGLEELGERVKTKNELQSNVEKTYKSQLKVLLGPDEASWAGSMDELKALEDIQPVEDEKTEDELNRALETCRRDQTAKNEQITQINAKIAAEFKVQRPEEVIWKADDLRQELKDMDILERAGQRVREVFDRLLQRSDAILDDIIGGQRVCDGFSRITGGKYQAVIMEDLVLQVTDAQGERWDFQDLSTGTRDQLLTILRLALAERRLQGKGFLIFDDALVTSDRTRLREQMEMLGQLTQDGWQILFLTAQDEVRQEAERLKELGVDVRLADL